MEPKKLPTRLLNVADIALKLGRTEKAIRRLVERRQIPHLRIGRRVQFCEATIDRWLMRHARRGMTLTEPLSPPASSKSVLPSTSARNASR